MTLTQAGIITILKTGTYPTNQKELNYYEQKQKYPVYPYVEVRKVQSDSNITDVQKTAKDQTFEIRFYIKYTRPEAVEEADRLATENEILRVLEIEDIEPTGVIYFESKSWNTSLIDDAIYGSRSVLRFTVKDISSTTAAGIIGSGDVLEINSAVQATGSVTLDTGASGSVSGITVNAVEIMSGSVAFNTSLEQTAVDVADNITANTSSPDYDAIAEGTKIIITSITTGTGPNGFVVISTTVTITSTDVNLAGGLAPSTIQMLALTTREGFSTTTHHDDDMIIKYDPSLKIDLGEFTITYETTTTLDSILQTISNAGIDNNGKITRGGTTTQFSFLVGQTTKTGIYGEIEKASTVFNATGIWV